MKIPDEILAKGAKIVVFDSQGRQIWRGTISEEDRAGRAWCLWAQYAAKKTLRKPEQDPNGKWGRWATAVAQGNRRRRVLGQSSHKAGANTRNASRGWVQAASRTATVLNSAHLRRRLHDRWPWELWAETVGSNAAKRRNNGRHNQKDGTEADSITAVSLCINGSAAHSTDS